MSSVLFRGGRRFPHPRFLERILLPLPERLEIQPGPVAVLECVRTQAIQRGRRQSAKPANLCLLRVGESPAVLAEDGLNARFDFGVALGRKLGQVRGLRRRGGGGRRGDGGGWRGGGGAAGWAG